MNCCPSDLRDYFFGEVPPAERKAVEIHLAGCAACREELDALRLTRTALLSVPDEEPPRRIAFVSDKVFEPGLWQRLWSSGPKLGFVSAAMLAAAILTHGVVMQPAGPSATPAVAASKADQKQLEADITRKVEASFARRIAELEQKQSAQFARVAAEQKRMEFDHKADVVTLGESFNVLQKRMGYLITASNQEPGAGR